MPAPHPLDIRTYVHTAVPRPRVTRSRVEMATESTVAKKRSFDAAFKLKVVDCAVRTTNRGAATKFFVDEKSVREWRKQKMSLMAMPDKKKRIYGGGRKASKPELEGVLVAWISDLRAGNH